MLINISVNVQQLHTAEEASSRISSPLTLLSALQSGTYHSSQRGARPGIAFRGHVYQPTEMALVMNGGTVGMATTHSAATRPHRVLFTLSFTLLLQMPTAPIKYTGRRLW